MTREVGCLCEGARDSILSVPVYAIGTDLCHPLSYRLRPWFTGIVSTLIPHHHGKQDANTTLMKVRDHLPYTDQTARHRSDQLQLVTIINSKIWVNGLQQNGVDAT